MNLLLLAAEDRRPEGLKGAVPGGVYLRTVHDWSGVLQELAQDPPPGALIIAAEALCQRTPGILRALHRSGQLIPCAIYLPQLEPRVLERAWQLAPLGVGLLIEQPGLQSGVGQLLRPEAALLGGAVARALQLTCPTSRRFLELLVDGGKVLREPTGTLAARLGVSRTHFYSLLAAARLPAVEQCQFLFRLFPAVRLLQRGGRAESATDLAQLADTKALRRALKLRFGSSIGELRSREGWRWLVKRWLALHGPADATPSRTFATLA